MDDEQYSSQAVHSARKKLPAGAFKEVNQYLLRGPHEYRVFAVDGSKVHVHPSFLNSGYKTRTSDQPVPRPAKRPLVMLSSMVDTRHFNERKAAVSMLRSVHQGDTLVFDRGYYSRGLLRNVHDSKAFGVWRLKINAFKGTRSFFNSWRTEATCIISGVKARLVKCFIDGKTYVCLTNDHSLSRADVKSMYASRWKDLKLEKAHARTPALYTPEVEARVFLDTITLRLQTKIKEPSYIYTLDTYVTHILRNIKNVSSHMRPNLTSEPNKSCQKQLRYPTRINPGRAPPPPRG